MFEDRDEDEPKVGKKVHPLDEEDMVRLHSRLLGFYGLEIDRQADNRREQDIDEEYFDNNQWSDEDKAILAARGQMAISYNVISSTVNWVTGTEKRSRMDYKVLPRRKDAAPAAERKTQILKYLSDVNRSPYGRSRAFEDSVKVGVGWLESGITAGDDGEPIYDRWETWRNMLWDSASSEQDLSDARYIMRAKWVDCDVAEALFPDRVGMIRASSDPLGSHDGLSVYGDDAMDAQESYMDETSGAHSAAESASRYRVRLIEVWYRAPAEVQRMEGGQFRGELYDPASPGHLAAVDSGESTVADRTTMRVSVAIMTPRGLLYNGSSPYRHNRFPFTPIWCYRRGKNGLPYGMIRGMRGLQDDVNKRASKALHIMSSNKVIMDEGAITADRMREFADEVARPDAIIVKVPGKELVINAERELSAAHLDLMSRSIQMIQSQSGVTDEALGRTTNATAGIAIQRRQEQAGMATAGIFDNMRFAAQVHGEKMLSLVEQFMTEQKQFRITNARGTPEYVDINDGLPENDIARTKSDFVLSEQDWRASIRQAQVEELLSFMKHVVPVNPQIGTIALDLIVEAMDLPNGAELVSRIRQMTGMRDPEAEGMSQEEVAKAEEAKVASDMQKRMAAAELAKAEAEAEHKAAQARKVVSEMSATNVGSQATALEAALAITEANTVRPELIGVADIILRESGFSSAQEAATDPDVSNVDSDTNMMEGAGYA